MDERVLHYVIERPLGAGGMGEVFLAEDERLGRRVALKFLPRADSADPERRERLRREARALASLSHPGIAAVYALEEHGDRLFLSMEYIEGETLAERLARRPLPVPEVVERGRVLAEALAHAHGRGVVHRDIKPSNILITPDGATKLADFGLALHGAATRLTVEGSTAGTADHMSPEQTRGETVDRRSDLFSLGVVLYEALTGVRPFARPSLEATFHAIRAEEPEAPTALRSGVPLELERIVMKLLRKEAGARYQSADDLAADLRALDVESTRTVVVSAGSGPSRTPESTSRAARPRRRGLWLLIPAALVAVAIGYFVLRPPGSGGEAVAAERSIAVVSFQNVPEPTDPRREAIMAASLLTVGLGQSQMIPVVGAQRVHDVMSQLGKSEHAITGTDALQIGKRAGATYVVTGYVFQTSPTMVLGAEVANVADGSVLTSRRVQVPGGDQAIFAAVDSLTVALRDGLAQAGFGVRSDRVDVASQTTRNPIALRAYARGLELLYQGDDRAARTELLAAVAADSTFSQAWYHLAVATWWDADFPEAEREVEAGLRLGSRLSDRDRDALRALRALTVRDWKDANERYGKLVVRYPDDKEFWYGLGEARWHGAMDVDGTRAALNKTLELDPHFGVAQIHLIDTSVLQDDLPAALADADRFRAIDPKNPMWIASKASAFGMLGQPDSALAYCRLYARVAPQTWVFGRMIVIHAMSGRPDSAEALISNAIRMAGPEAAELPSLASSWLALARGRFAEAAAEADRGMRQLGTTHIDSYATLLVLRTEALIEAGRADEGLQQLAKGRSKLPAEVDDASPVPRAVVVDLDIRAGHVADARRILREIEERLRRKPDTWRKKGRDYAAGLVALGEGRAREAVRLLEHSRPLVSVAELRDVENRWALARALLAAGERDRALVELEKCSKRFIYGGNPIAAFRATLLLAKEYERMGRRDDALASYRRVAFQYRDADPGYSVNEEAKAGVARLERARAQAAAR